MNDQRLALLRKTFDAMYWGTAGIVRRVAEIKRLLTPPYENDDVGQHIVLIDELKINKRIMSRFDRRYEARLMQERTRIHRTNEN